MVLLSRTLKTAVAAICAVAVVLGVLGPGPAPAAADTGKTWTFTFGPDRQNTGGGSAAQQYLTVYYVRVKDGEAYLVREVHPTTHKILTWFAVDELINGQPRTPGAFKVLNPDTWVRSIVIADGRATVDFAAPIFKGNLPWELRELGLQSIVNTLTEFQEIREVRFTVSGARYSWLYSYRQRDLSRVREDGGRGPAIWPTNIRKWQWVSSPLVVKGQVRDFTGLVRARLLNYEGKVIGEGYAWIDEDTGPSGAFCVRLAFSTPENPVGTLRIDTWNAANWETGPGYSVPVLYAG